MVIRDGDWKLFDYDFQSGRSVWVMNDGNRTVFRTDYPIETTLNTNATLRKEAQKAWAGDYHLVASIPLNIWNDEDLGLQKAHLSGDDRYVSRWLNDPDNKAFRTKEGTV